MDEVIQAKQLLNKILQKKRCRKGVQDFTKQLEHVLNDHSLVSITDVKGNIIYANSKFCDVSGYSLAELMGSDHRILKSGFHDKEYYKDIWMTIASGQTWCGEICNKAKNGKLYWVQSTIVPFLDKENQKPEYYVAVRTEITHQKELQEKLDQLLLEAIVANEAKSSFLTNMSHELRTPLNHIIGFSEVLEMSTKDPDLLENVDYIKKAGHELLNKISNILELVGLSSEPTRKTQIIDIVDLANNEFIGYFWSTANKSKRKFSVTIPDQNIYISADRMDLLIAFRKVADNAVLFSSEDDIVGMSMSVNGETVTVSIFDTGPGLPKYILSSNLEPFTIGEKVTTKEKSGMGLGLPIAKKLCIQNGGSFEIEDNEDIGTRIHFRFPIIQQEVV